ncbi:hypothetical protein M3650_22070 [Paenibacillus sp. MER TA 81-3]|uniref:hypothetical protein n=1 Tax=Paenibacillus sp. MER TA 81-3 TaxID=2939573 RepID=UPI00203AF47D|nr:hypothetical protein [Paenibacillus sp. MER TA 81-3]MCM3341242.1 hypothetical protein [Paenibacillus sp. MER TA 81-3]
MEQFKEEMVRRAIEIGIVKDPQWMERLDEPVPMWVLLEMVMRLHDVLNPPHKPFD